MRGIFWMGWVGLSSLILGSCRAEPQQNQPTTPSLSSCSTNQLQPDPAAHQITKLTQDLTQLADRLDPILHQKNLQFQIQQIARQRHRLIAALAQESPQIIPSLTLTREVRTRLAETPETCLEKQVQIQGRLEVYDAIQKDGRPHLFGTLKTQSGKKYRIYFARSPTTTGIEVQIQGQYFSCGNDGSPFLVSESLAPGDPKDAGEMAFLPNTLGTQQTAVLLLNFQDRLNPYSQRDVQDVVFGKVHQYIFENSFQKTGIGGQVFGPWTVPITSTSCDYSAIATAAMNAAQSNGVDLSSYPRLLYVFPQSACNWLGLGTIGGQPSQAWINGSLDLHTVAHEMGHNLGLFHSNAWNCDMHTLGQNCTNIEYGDTADAMGNYFPGHFNAFQKERLGWLGLTDSPSIQTINSSGVYFVDTYESSTSKSKALKILKSVSNTGAKTFYYVEFRQGLGYDQVLSQISWANNLTGSLLVHTGSDSDPNSSYLLNLNPQLKSWYEAGLVSDQTFVDASNGITIKLVSGSDSGAWVDVGVGQSTASSACTALSATQPAQSSSE